MDQILTNSQVRVVFDESDQCINFYDLLDQYNDQKGFTRNKRGIAKAWVHLKNTFNNETKFFEVSNILDSLKLKTHIYCGMD